MKYLQGRTENINKEIYLKSYDKNLRLKKDIKNGVIINMFE